MNEIYISLLGLERYSDQQFKNEELNEWILENVPRTKLNFTRWHNHSRRPPYLTGMYLDEEQAIIFKLRFKLKYETDI